MHRRKMEASYPRVAQQITTPLQTKIINIKIMTAITSRRNVCRSFEGALVPAAVIKPQQQKILLQPQTDSRGGREVSRLILVLYLQLSNMQYSVMSLYALGTVLHCVIKLPVMSKIQLHLDKNFTSASGGQDPLLGLCPGTQLEDRGSSEFRQSFFQHPLSLNPRSTLVSVS